MNRLLCAVLPVYGLVCASNPAAGDERIAPKVMAFQKQVTNQPQASLNPLEVRLGQILFFDPRLSGNNSTSCATCHNPSLGWSDGEKTPLRFPLVKRRSQSLWDVGSQRLLFWDGRAASLEQQAAMPVEDANEMNSSRLKVVKIALRDPETRALLEQGYGALPAGLSELLEQSGFNVSGSNANPGAEWRRLFDALAPDAKAMVSRVFEHLMQAVAVFERAIDSGQSRFELGLANETRQSGTHGFSPREIRGMNLFFGAAGCVQCHSGPNLSDGLFHLPAMPDPQEAGMAGLLGKAPLPLAEHAGSRNALAANQGLQVCGSKVLQAQGPAQLWRRHGQDRELDFNGLLRTPSLKNVASHPPYLHNGSAPGLLQAVQQEAARKRRCVNGKLAPARRFSEEELLALTDFLQTLTSGDMSPHDPGRLSVINLKTGMK